MKDLLDLFDIINLEYFLGQDRDRDRDALHHRDRQICLEFADPEHLPPKKRLLSEWLERRMKQDREEGGGLLPGLVLRELYRTLSMIIATAGMIFGGMAAGGLLHYTGERPVNVFVYLFLFVVLPFMLSLLPATMLLRGTGKGGNRGFSLIHDLLASCVLRLLKRAELQISRKLDGERRAGLQAVNGLVRGYTRIYGSLFLWPLFLMGQLGGIFFLTGVLAVTVGSVLIKDIGFGWQSTLQPSAQAVSSIISSLALPWRFLPAEWPGYPSLAEIEGSHIILKDGIYHLASSDLASWWPFLCLSVLVYGLLPRIMLFWGGLSRKRAALEAIGFTHNSVESLIRRMSTPLVTTSDVQPAEEPVSEPDREDRMEPEETVEEVVPEPARAMILLLPDDLQGVYEKNADFRGMLVKGIGCDMGEEIVIGRDYSEDRLLVEQLGVRDPRDYAGIVYLAEGWMAPITDTLDFLKELRGSVGDEVRILVGLIGKVREGRMMKPTEQDWKVWHDKLDGLGDPWLSLERIGA